ncbi:MAG: metallophosphoesterase [Bacteroidota bacterium]
MVRSLSLTLTLVLSGFVGYTQDLSFPQEWWLWPDYTLGNNASNTIGPRLPAPETPQQPLQSKSYPFVFFGQDPTERLEDFLPSSAVPIQAFTVEMWMLNHVNQEVGAFTAFRDRYNPDDPAWLIGQFGREILLTFKGQEAEFSSAINIQIEERGWKNYWVHLVGTYDGSSLRLYLNGELKETLRVGRPKAFEASAYQLEAAAYLSNEPYMQLGDLVKRLSIDNRAKSLDEIKTSYESLQQLVTEGKIYPDLFHFTAGPYLQMVTDRQMGMVWETSEPANTVIEYGTSVPLTQSISLETMKLNRETSAFEGSLVNRHILAELQSDQPYFYNIKSTNAAGETIESGILTFKTAPTDPASFTFSVIGDTEARPHVNSRVAQLIWDERPEFLMNLGDLTDGGREANKFQWNYEYFYGMNQLTSRVPCFPVAGNGEGDLYWFRKYHILPSEDDGYYKFSYGNADFFMLDSNQREEFSKGGEQYEWLKTQLSQSTARWKFVAHHHAPYSSDEDDYGNSWEGPSSMGDPMVKKIVPVYEEYGVDVVFFGHLHTYQRTHKISDKKISKSKGVTYIQAGGAGGNLEDFAPTRSWFSAKTFRGHHYLTVEVFGEELELRMYDSEGRMKDIYQISKGE